MILTRTPRWIGTSPRTSGSTHETIAALDYLRAENSDELDTYDSIIRDLIEEATGRTVEELAARAAEPEVVLRTGPRADGRTLGRVGPYSLTAYYTTTILA